MAAVGLDSAASTIAGRWRYSSPAASEFGAPDSQKAVCADELNGESVVEVGLQCSPLRARRQLPASHLVVKRRCHFAQDLRTKLSASASLKSIVRAILPLFFLMFPKNFFMTRIGPRLRSLLEVLVGRK